MGQGRFELPSKRPKRSRMDQATLLPLYLHMLESQTKIVADEGEGSGEQGVRPLFADDGADERALHDRPAEVLRVAAVEHQERDA